MTHSKISIAFLRICVSLALIASCSAGEIAIRGDGVFLQDGKPVFPIGFTKAPPAGAMTPWQTNGYAELKKNGAVFHRCAPSQTKWGPEAEAELDRLMDASAKQGLLCAVYLPALETPTQPAQEDELRRVVNKYKSHPALGYWKGSDEPEWGKVPVSGVKRYYDIVHQTDPKHPVWITQAPRGTIESLKAYDPAYDVVAIDIYPVSYPPGLHSHLPNKNISVTGDYVNWLQQITERKKPIWMVLQICFSGVTNPGRTLRFPTFAEERYMSYQSIIGGARGLLYFGGNVEACLNSRDKPLGWNWHFYEAVLRPLLEEFRPGSPVYPALVAANSKLPVRVEGADDIEYCVRESGNQIFLLASKREGSTVKVTFRGLPENLSTGDLLFEEPRKVTAASGSFSDWFGPNEVHVYRFSRP